MKQIKVHRITSPRTNMAYTTRNKSGKIVTTTTKEDKESGGTAKFGILHSANAWMEGSYRKNEHARLIHNEFASGLTEFNTEIRVNGEYEEFTLMGEVSVKTLRQAYDKSAGYADDMCGQQINGFNIAVNNDGSINNEHDYQRYLIDPIYLSTHSTMLSNALDIESGIRDLGILKKGNRQGNILIGDKHSKQYVKENYGTAHLDCCYYVEVKIQTPTDMHYLSSGGISPVFTTLDKDVCESIYLDLIDRVRTEKAVEYKEFLVKSREGYPVITGLFPPIYDDVGTTRNKIDAFQINDADGSHKEFKEIEVGSTVTNIMFRITEGRKKRWLAPDELHALVPTDNFKISHEESDDRVSIIAPSLNIKHPGKKSLDYCRTPKQIEKWKARDVRGAIYGPSKNVQVQLGNDRYATNIKVSNLPSVDRVINFFKSDGTQVEKIKMGETISNVVPKLLDNETGIHTSLNAIEMSILEGVKGSTLSYDVGTSELSIACDKLYYINKDDKEQTRHYCTEEKWATLKQFDDTVVCGPVKSVKVEHDYAIYDTGITVDEYPMVNRETGDDTPNEEGRVPENEVYKDIPEPKITLSWNELKKRPIIPLNKWVNTIWDGTDENFKRLHRKNYDKFFNELVKFSLACRSEFEEIGGKGIHIPVCNDEPEVWGSDKFVVYLSLAFNRWFEHNYTAKLLANALDRRKKSPTPQLEEVES
jgi:hypothetical protein